VEEPYVDVIGPEGSEAGFERSLCLLSGESGLRCGLCRALCYGGEAFLDRWKLTDERACDSAGDLAAVQVFR